MKKLLLIFFLLTAFNIYSQDNLPQEEKETDRFYTLDEIKKNIQYPQEAKERGIQGKVVIKVLIDETGKVIGDKGLVEGDQIFYNEIKKWIYKLKIQPAIMNGEPIKCYINIPFIFVLQD
jgi:TonB family protein